MTPNPQKKRGAGWFCEVDPVLKAEFKRLYPGRAAMKRWTVFAIKLAIMRHPSNQPNEEKASHED